MVPAQTPTPKMFGASSGPSHFATVDTQKYQLAHFLSPRGGGDSANQCLQLFNANHVKLCKLTKCKKRQSNARHTGLRSMIQRTGCGAIMCHYPGVLIYEHRLNKRQILGCTMMQNRANCAHSPIHLKLCKIVCLPPRWPPPGQQHPHVHPPSPGPPFCLFLGGGGRVLGSLGLKTGQ